MFFLIPIGHNRFVVRELPFVTIGIMLVCMALFFPTTTRMETDAENMLRAQQTVMKHYNRHPHLEMPDDLYEFLPPDIREAVSQRLQWKDWYETSPSEAVAWSEAWFHENEKLKRARPGSSGILDALNPFPGKSCDDCNLNSATLVSHAYKAAAIRQLDTLSAVDIQGQQAELNDLSVVLIDTIEGSVLQRFAFVSRTPRLPGMITYMFLHGGILHLIFNLLFLWLAAVKLEDIWGRALFAGLFVFFGIGSAIAHMVGNPESGIPVIGASGAVAGFMGAFMIRLSRTRIRFFYFFWLLRLKPYTGVFQAKAYVMLPIWFGIEMFYALFLGSSDVAHWTHVGGFALGVAVAVGFRFAGFEQRVLGRDPDDDPDVDDEEQRRDAPLVAFQSSGQADSRSLNPPPATVLTPAPEAANRSGTIRARRELLIRSFEQELLNGATPGGRPVQLSRADVVAIALGRVERIAADPLSRLFSAGVPAEPAYVVILLETSSATEPTKERVIWLIDGQKCRWNDLFPGTEMSRRVAMQALTRALLKTFSGASYIQGGAIGPDRIPIYQSLEDFIRTVEKKTTA